jgi:hypothetical protein
MHESFGPFYPFGYYQIGRMGNMARPKENPPNQEQLDARADELEGIMLDREDQVMNAVVRAMNDLPILQRLEFVRNTIFDAGGDRSGLPRNPGLVVATEVLSEVMNALAKKPEFNRPARKSYGVRSEPS